MGTFVRIVVDLFLLAVLPPLLPGLIGKIKAFAGGRVGPPLLQLYYDLVKLFRKGSVFSTTTTWIFRTAPVVSVATTLLAALLIPLGNHGAIFSFNGDLILFVYLFGLGRFFTTLAALDTGSPFEGMGAAREVTFACLAELAFFFGLMVLAKVSGSLSLSEMLGPHLGQGWITAKASLVLVLGSWFIVLLAENCRIPFDDPNTHLELTMIHEVMVLDHSGPALGMILYGAALKLFVFSTLIVSVVAPLAHGSAWGRWGILVGGVLVVTILIAWVESVLARLRLIHIPNFLVGACLLSAFGILLLER